MFQDYPTTGIKTATMNSEVLFWQGCASPAEFPLLLTVRRTRLATGAPRTTVSPYRFVRLISISGFETVNFFTYLKLKHSLTVSCLVFASGFGTVNLYYLN
jgi:hypothetical protein